MSTRGLALLGRAFIAPLLTILLPLSASAQTDLDASLSAALDLIVAARVAEAPAATGLDLRVGSNAPKLLLRRVVVRVDESSPISYDYSDLESSALRAGGLHPLATLKLTPGLHRLRAEFVAREPDSAPSSPRVRQYLDRQVSIGEGVMQLRIELVPETLRTKGEVQLVAQAPNADGGAVALRSARFLAASERHLAASIEWLSLQQAGIALPYDAQQGLSASLQALGPASRVAAADSSQGARYQSYNQAAAALGDAQGAVLGLQAVGTGEARDGEGLALRDQANVSLGFHALKLRDGRAAIDAFNRVRSPGPFSNPALLGLGWAYLLPSSRPASGAAPAKAGSLQDYVMPASEDELAELRRRTPFRRMQSVATGALEEDVRRALVPWIELIGRDPLDAAVQEGMLAIPYAIDHLGAHEDAQKYYLRAVTQLERARSAAQKAIADVAAGGLAKIADGMHADVGNGWHWWLADLPDGRWWRDELADAPPSFYMKALLARSDFVAALESYRDLHLALSLIESHSVALAAIGGSAPSVKAQIDALRPSLAARVAVQRAVMESLATDELRKLLLQTERYLVEAQLAIARTHDRAPAGDAP